ncbi:hypothetical protein QR680_009716 [Steinernema hermaphroditum]|uniref:Adenylate kinase isoenzyme 6 homolog n=1 Tax=Steinernema hermaphroditum TaxID=289476 RepID=A0AA39IN55_9BILA|nr:hypothetical protein QR680_009716 [Steinernema hermaphroditum]
METGRVRPNILITGTPGTGKSSLAEMLMEEHPEMRSMDIYTEAEIHGCFAEFDEQRNCKVIDDDLLLDAIEDRMSEREGGFVIDYHATAFFPERYFDYVIVLRTDNTLLFDRLAARGYSQEKIRENVECEIFGVIADEVEECYPNVREIKVLKSDSLEDCQQNVIIISDLIKQWTP